MAIVFGVNDGGSRIGWLLMALLCVYGAVKAVKAMKIELDDDFVGYKYLGMASVTLYLIRVLKSIFSEAPSPVYRAHRWVRTIVPWVLNPIIYFTIYNFQTSQVFVLVLSIVFGLAALVQLVCPVEGFHFPYVVSLVIFMGLLALFALDHDPKIQPFWFCFLTLFLFQMLIYFVNCPGDDLRWFSFY